MNKKKKLNENNNKNTINLIWWCDERWIHKFVGKKKLLNSVLQRTNTNIIEFWSDVVSNSPQPYR